MVDFHPRLDTYKEVNVDGKVEIDPLNKLPLRSLKERKQWALISYRKYRNSLNGFETISLFKKNNSILDKRCGWEEKNKKEKKKILSDSQIFYSRRKNAEKEAYISPDGISRG